MRWWTPGKAAALPSLIQTRIQQGTPPWAAAPAAAGLGRSSIRMRTGSWRVRMTPLGEPGWPHCQATSMRPPAAYASSSSSSGRRPSGGGCGIWGHRRPRPRVRLHQRPQRRSRRLLTWCLTATDDAAWRARLAALLGYWQAPTGRLRQGQQQRTLSQRRRLHFGACLGAWRAVEPGAAGTGTCACGGAF